MGQKVVVFGGSGFLGSHVADILTEKKHEVVIFDIEKSKYLLPEQKMVVGDILDLYTVLNAVKDAEVVYNFAGVTDIHDAIDNPTQTITSNVIGNMNILEACRKNKVKRYVFASTIYVYSDRGSFYRASKQSCELFIESYQKQFGVDFTVLRYGSLYGPRAGESNWINSIIKDFLKKKKVVRKGDGQEIREYIHVHDAAKLTVKMMEKEYVNQYAIITGQQTMRINDVLLMIKEMLGNNIEIEFVPEDNDSHYEITPYSFKPKFARKVTDNNYVDFGQGILELLDKEYGNIAGEKYSSQEHIK